MKKTAFALAVSVLAVLMVLPSVSTVNHPANKDVWNEKTLRADGSPMPVPLPPPDAATLVADGSPMPVPLPPPDAVTLVADGSLQA